MQVPQSIFLMNSTSSEQVSSLSSAALPPAQSSPISSPPSTGRPPIVSAGTGSSPCYGPAASPPAATGSGSRATSSESCAAFGRSYHGLGPSPNTSLSTGPGVQWRWVHFSCVRSIRLSGLWYPSGPLQCCFAAPHRVLHGIHARPDRLYQRTTIHALCSIAHVHVRPEPHSARLVRRSRWQSLPPAPSLLRCWPREASQTPEVSGADPARGVHWPCGLAPTPCGTTSCPRSFCWTISIF